MLSVWARGTRTLAKVAESGRTSSTIWSCNFRERSIKPLASATIEAEVSEITGGGCGGIRPFPVAILDVSHERNTGKTLLLQVKQKITKYLEGGGLLYPCRSNKIRCPLGPSHHTCFIGRAKILWNSILSR
jgi:hypothetical protein